MLEPEVLSAHIAAGEPALFHVTAAENVQAIEREGLRPGSDLGKSTREDFFKTRKGRVYLIREREVAIVEVGPAPRVFRVDLAQLDPELIEPGEDVVRETFPDAVSQESPQRELDGNKELPGQVGRLAAWADSIAGELELSDLAGRSLKEGRICYRGTIPPSALQLIDVASPVLVVFTDKLSDSLSENLPKPPASGDWQVEARRARGVLHQAVGGICTVVGHEREIELEDVYACRRTRDGLMDVMRALHKEGRFEAGNAVAAAREAVGEAEDLGDLPLPLPQLAAAREVGAAAAVAIDETAGVPEVGGADVKALAAAVFHAGAEAV